MISTVKPLTSAPIAGRPVRRWLLQWQCPRCGADCQESVFGLRGEVERLRDAVCVECFEAATGENS